MSRQFLVLAGAVVAVPKGSPPPLRNEWSTAMLVSSYAPQGLYTGLENHKSAW